MAGRPFAAPLGWKQLRHRPLRLLVAVAGIAFAVLLIMMQLGFRAALFESTLRFHERFEYDIALFSPDSVFIVRPAAFSIRRLYQALGADVVEEVSPVYIFPAVWKNPWGTDRRAIQSIGVDPARARLDTPGFAAGRELLRQQDVLLFDAASRPEFGDIRARFAADGPITTEVNNRTVRVVGLVDIGPSFGIDGTVMTSIDNWLRLFPERPREEIQLGLIRLAPGADPVAARERLQALAAPLRGLAETVHERLDGLHELGRAFAIDLAALPPRPSAAADEALRRPEPVA